MPGVQPQCFGKACHLSEHEAGIFRREIERTGDSRVDRSKEK